MFILETPGVENTQTSILKFSTSNLSPKKESIKIFFMLAFGHLEKVGSGFLVKPQYMFLWCIVYTEISSQVYEIKCSNQNALV